MPVVIGTRKLACKNPQRQNAHTSLITHSTHSHSLSVTHFLQIPVQFSKFLSCILCTRIRREQLIDFLFYIFSFHSSVSLSLSTAKLLTTTQYSEQINIKIHNNSTHRFPHEILRLILRLLPATASSWCAKFTIPLNHRRRRYGTTCC